jgi:dynein heavy chain
LKCVQLAEILDVRHSVFIIGNPGCGKSSIWRNLAAAFTAKGMPTVFEIVDPKA